MPKPAPTPAEPLPTFVYHPDPVATGSVEPSKEKCVCCGEQRGYIYSGPAYAEEELDEKLCPWCIADGSAHEEFEVSFHDEAGVPGSSFDGAPDVSDEVIDTLCHRTPGFTAWQQEEWFTCCNDAAMFLGRAGREELEKHGPQAVEALKQTAGLDGGEWDEFLDALSEDDSPTAYVFKCRHCGKFGVYADSN
jgi:uncharacterized protein CbrC (UPF0167 family)